VKLWTFTEDPLAVKQLRARLTTKGNGGARPVRKVTHVREAKGRSSGCHIKGRRYPGERTPNSTSTASRSLHPRAKKKKKEQLPWPTDDDEYYPTPDLIGLTAV